MAPMADPQRMAEETGGPTASVPIDIPRARPPAGGRALLASVDSMSPIFEDRMTTSTTTNRDMSKKKMEELVRKLTLDELKSQWFVDEIVSKVQTELVESPHGSPAQTPITEEPASPRPAPNSRETHRWNKPYQATVEDETESQADMDESLPSSRATSQVSAANTFKKATKRGSVASSCSPTSSVVSEAVSSHASNVSSLRNAGSSATLHTPTESPHPSPKSRPTVRFSDRVPVVLNSRPSPPEPRKSEMNISRQIAPEPVLKTRMSAVDLKWGILFDEREEPTARLGQLLRGIAKYIAATYTPMDSTVLTPDKLLAFYSRYKLDSEVLPFHNLFDTKSRRSIESLEDLYQDLRCNYWLVQSRPNSRSPPCIPALTPNGFADWMVQQIQAFPDQEAKRLGRVLEELPIEADTMARDGNPERLPKQLSRHLLPTDRHRGVHDKVINAINVWFKSAGYIEPPRKESREDNYRSPRKSSETVGRDDNGSRHRSQHHESRSEQRSSGHRRNSQDSYVRTTDPGYYRSEPSSRHISRTNSEQMVRHPREASPPPVGPHHRVRSPAASNRYRSSVPSLSSTGDDYGLTSSSYHNGASPTTYSSSAPRSPVSDRRNKDQEYRFYQNQDPRASVESTPRSLGHESKRRSLVIPRQPRGEAGSTFEEFYAG